MRRVAQTGWPARLAGLVLGLVAVYVTAALLAAAVRPYLTAIFVLLILAVLAGWWQRSQYL